jgi:glycosyltransferase involved in cell wall biosynthesis
MSGAMSPPDVSVVIPTRDRWNLLSRAVGTALAQRGVTVQVTVVDDGSRLPAPPLPELRDPRVTLLQEPARGVAAARNLGARRSTARWLAFLDDDDIWAPEKLASLLGAAGRAGAGFAYSSVLMIAADLTPLLVDPGPPPAGLVRRLLEINAIPGGGSNVVVDRALFDQVGGFDESLSFLADWDAWLRLAQAAPAARVEDALTAYSCHLGNWVLRHDNAVEGDYRRFSAKHAELIRRHGAALNRLHYDRHIAASHLRAGRRWTAGRRLVRAGLRERDLPTVARGLVVLAGPRFLARLRRRRRGLQAPSWLSAHEPMAIAP